MAALRRICRYGPAALMAMLLIAWAASVFGYYGVGLRWGRLNLQTAAMRSELQYSFSVLPANHRLGPSYRVQTMRFEREWPLHHVATYLGRVRLTRIPQPHDRNQFEIVLPYLALLTALFPLALGGHAGFRFCIRQWFAFTALVAVEMAYYLPTAEWRWFW